MRLVWSEAAWQDYLWWQTQDRKVLKRINALIADVARAGNVGIGKPEPLKYELSGYWSRRITDEHRLVYRVTADEIRIAACRYHYGRCSQQLESSGSAAFDGDRCPEQSPMGGDAGDLGGQLVDIGTDGTMVVARRHHRGPLAAVAPTHPGIRTPQKLTN